VLENYAHISTNANCLINSCTLLFREERTPLSPKTAGFSGASLCAENKSNSEKTATRNQPTQNELAKEVDAQKHWALIIECPEKNSNLEVYCCIAVSES